MLGMPEDEADQDRLHDGRRCAQRPFAKTEHLPRGPSLRHRDTARLVRDRRGLIVGRRRRAHPHDSTSRRSRPLAVSPRPTNLQNVPIRTEEGRRIREASSSGTGSESLMSADYSQIEMRIMAHLSGDAGLIEAFRTGRTRTASSGRGCSASSRADVTAEMRSKVKAMMSYGWPMACRLSACPSNWVSRPVRRRASWTSTLPASAGSRLPARCRHRGRQAGVHRDDVRRRRYLPDLTSDKPAAARDGRTDGLNAPIQGRRPTS